ncbi:adipolin-like [Tachypleus tridentatus]|uniref:adipolin-like n=1 Tax=Tachypleus tridentatus TaxID=6853 RepID=UPI003FD3C5BF
MFFSIFLLLLVSNITGAGVIPLRPTPTPSSELDLDSIRYASETRSGRISHPKQPAKNLVRPLILDPRQTWEAFIRHTERTKKEKRKSRNRLRSGSGRLLPYPEGPPGPPGPLGPRGPPGANITKKEMLEEFRSVVRGAAERYIERIIGEKCRDDNLGKPRLLNQTGPYVPPLFDIDHAAIISKVPFAFFWQLSENVKIKRKSFMELKNFHVPFADGAFQRGNGGSSTDGHFQAPRDGLYLFYLSLLIKHRAFRLSRTPGPQDRISAYVCIDSACTKNIALLTTQGLDANSAAFTIAVSGILFLKEGQYASVYVANNSRFKIKVMPGSQFSGVLAGI